MDELREQQVTLSDYLRVLYRGRWIIAISFIIVMAATVYFTFTTQPVYESAATVLIKEDRVQTQVFDMSSFMKKETMINNQVVILKSRRLAEAVVRDLQDSPYADSLWILGNREADRRFSIMTWIKKLLPGEAQGAGPLFDELVKNFRQGSISVAPQRDTDVIELRSSAFSPSEAALIANTWMKAYQDLDIAESTGEVGKVRKFLEEKLVAVEDSLYRSEQRLKNFKETEGVTELTAETQALIERTAEFESLYQSAKTDYEANQKRIQAMNVQLDEAQKIMLNNASSASSEMIGALEIERARLAGGIAKEEKQLKAAGYFNNASMRSGLEEKMAQLEGIQEKIILEKKKLIAAGGAINAEKVNDALFTNLLTIQAENDYLKEKTSALDDIVKQYKRELNQLPGKSLQLANLQREARVNNTIYIMLREKFEENRIAEAGQIGSVRIIDYAKKPEFPTSPKKKMNLLLGLMLGLGLGVGLTFGREYLDTSLKTIEDVEHMGFPVLGSIPFIASQAMAHQVKDNGNGDVKQIQSRLISHFAPKSPVSEAYRSLRTNIQYCRPDEPIQTAVVTSSGPGEGKSTTISNLAITMAQTGAKTVIVDCDLRRPVMHGIFSEKRGVGITNYLAGKASFDEIVRTTKVDNLDLITAGVLPPNPSELLASKSMDRFIEEARGRYEMILFDTPPVIAVTDATVLGRKLDGVVLVMKSGSTNRDALLRAKQLLDNVNAKLLGVTVNGVNIENMYGSYYYYYHYYYYGENNKKKRRMPRIPGIKV
ncbi:polysaccharide biosynthesis tyrosine autokinase [bacterium]|nr:polysaccharide biosynthesis tyrosine autokinase [bacterium]